MKRLYIDFDGVVMDTIIFYFIFVNLEHFIKIKEGIIFLLHAFHLMKNS